MHSQNTPYFHITSTLDDAVIHLIMYHRIGMPCQWFWQLCTVRIRRTNLIVIYGIQFCQANAHRATINEQFITLRIKKNNDNSILIFPFYDFHFMEKCYFCLYLTMIKVSTRFTTYSSLYGWLRISKPTRTPPHSASFAPCGGIDLPTF